MSSDLERPAVACSTGSFWMWDLERTFGTIAEAGFESVELMVTRDPLTQSARAPRDLAKKYGLTICAVHAPMLVVTRRVWGPNFLNIINKSVDLAHQLDAGLVVIHPPFLFELKYQAWLLGEMEQYSRNRGLAIAVENMFHLWVKGKAVRGHRWLSPADLDGFHNITLDTSHCGVDGTDILAALDQVGPHLSHIHLSDSRGDHRDSHALPGSGILPLGKFVTRLPEVGYNGTVSLELDMREWILEPGRLVDLLTKARDFTLECLS
ncbi:MAG TPA: sugar phosphate isomerase/epimerase [Actinomycetota bacterium]